MIANVAIIATEYLNRTGVGGWTSVLPQTFPLIVVAQWSLYHAFNNAPHWFMAWVVFTVGNSIMRISAVGIMGDKVSSWPLALGAIGVMMAGAFLMKSALR